MRRLQLSGIIFFQTCLDVLIPRLLVKLSALLKERKEKNGEKS